MIRSLVFDKDGVILDMAGTWLPVARQVADYTLSRQPEGVRHLTRAALWRRSALMTSRDHRSVRHVCQRALPGSQRLAGDAASNMIDLNMTRSTGPRSSALPHR